MNPHPMVATPRLHLIPCVLQHFEAILHDQRRLAQLLGATVVDDWFEFPGVAGLDAIRSSYAYLQAHPDALGWWTYLFIHVPDRTLVGIGGYYGPADDAGRVELGYAIIPAYRGQGLATEAAAGLIAHAFAHPHIQRVDAHTLAEPNASTGVLEHVGMVRVGSTQDPEVGTVWEWSVGRDAYRQA